MSVSVYDENVYVNGCIKTYAMRQVACRYGIEHLVACRVVCVVPSPILQPLVPVNPPHSVHFLPQMSSRAITRYLPSHLDYVHTYTFSSRPDWMGADN